MNARVGCSTPLTDGFVDSRASFPALAQACYSSLLRSTRSASRRATSSTRWAGRRIGTRWC